ncbi:MAG TPA: rRNA maturation RNase YbeY [Clostridiaceae bacterium]
MYNNIQISNLQSIVKEAVILSENIQTLIDYTLKKEEVLIPCEISLVYVDNEQIRKINKKNRNIDKETDVLSFPMLPYEKSKVFKDIYKDNIFKIQDLDNGKLVLGDIVISFEKALNQSIEYNHSFPREVCYLLVHSILHLLGYDHMEEMDQKKMREREENILEGFDVSLKKE